MTVVNETRRNGFYLGSGDDGKFVAASVDSVVFCFIEETEEEAVAKACRAYEFANSVAPRNTPSFKSRTSTVIDFVPARRIPICETPLAAAAG